MNRRQFLKTSAAAACLVAVPVGSLSKQGVGVTRLKIIQQIKYENNDIETYFNLFKNLDTNEYINMIWTTEGLKEYRYNVQKN